MFYRTISMLAVLTASVFTLKSVYADAAAEMARKLQNPLANINALTWRS